MQLTVDCTPQNVEAISTIAAILNDQPIDQDAIKRAMEALSEKLNSSTSTPPLFTPVVDVFPIGIANTLMRNNINFVEEIVISDLSSFKRLGDKSIQVIKDFIEKGITHEVKTPDTTKSAGEWVCLSDRYSKEEVEFLDRQIFDYYLFGEGTNSRIKLHCLSPELLDYLVLATQTRKQPERMQAFVKSHFLDKQPMTKSAALIDISVSHARQKLAKFERQTALYARRLIEKFGDLL